MTVPDEPTMPATPPWGVLTIAVEGDEAHAALVTSDGRRQIFLKSDDEGSALVQAERAACVIRVDRAAFQKATRITINREQFNQ